MEIKLFINNKAKQIIKLITKEINDKNKQYIVKWLNEQNNVKCFVLYENNIIKGFAILSKCDYDPLNKHINPYILDLIYIFQQYRRNNLAYELLIYLKSTNCITAFCSNNESIMLFKKAEYVLTKYDAIPIPTFRYP
jgi:hypothetical protein